jgi:4-aminobutyrate aminotransferase
MEELIRTSTSGRIAGFIAEPIQGIGGFITPPKEYFEIVAGIVKKFGGLFISDEVQTAWGRTGGKWFGIEHFGIIPDMITSAKGLGNGLPIGVTVARPDVAAGLKGLTISTFGGNPVTTTAAKAVIDFIDEHQLLINAAETGAHLRGKLDELKARHPLIGDVRGMGLMQAIELVEDRETKAPATAATAALMEAARENRLLMGRGGIDGNVIRVTPPLNISKSDVDDFAERLSASFGYIERSDHGRKSVLSRIENH